jgi:hypothetical protein
MTVRVALRFRMSRAVRQIHQIAPRPSRPMNAAGFQRWLTS